MTDDRRAAMMAENAIERYTTMQDKPVYGLNRNFTRALRQAMAYASPNSYIRATIGKALKVVDNDAWRYDFWAHHELFRIENALFNARRVFHVY